MFEGSDDENGEGVLRYLAWSPRAIRSAPALRAALRRIRRFIDFDGTIAVPRSLAPMPFLRGKPLAAYLGEAPFAVQTWNPVSALRFFLDDHPRLPRPRMVLVAPMREIRGERGTLTIGKDFSRLGIGGAHIIDDMPAESIRAPGCVVLPP